MLRNLRNAFLSIRRNKLRSVLAGFGIAWGIFLLVIFLGIGNGFRNGIADLFNGYAQKSLFVYGGQTTIATERLNGRVQILFHNSIIQELKYRYGSIRACSPELSLPSMPTTAEGETIATQVKGVSSEYFQIRILNVKAGRPLGPMDDRIGRNVAVIGEGVEQALFSKSSGLGKQVILENAIFEVVGILSSENLFSLQDRNAVYIPYSTFQANFHSEEYLSSFCLSLSSEGETVELEKDLRGWLAWRYGFDPHDEQAIYISNIEAQTSAFDSLFSGLEGLIWIVGICLLLSGIVGVCNVMLIIVRERTGEIGIRKAVGATSGSVISMMLTESLLITSLAGIVGVLFGIGVVYLADRFLLPLLDIEVMGNLHVDGMAVAAALIILCLSGILAGLYPALKASRIAPMNAIRYENRE